MKTRILLTSTTHSQTPTGRLRTVSALRLISLLLLLLLPARAQADSYDGFTYTVANGAATITGYTGAGGAVAIPMLVYLEVGGIDIPFVVTAIGEAAFYTWPWRTNVTSVFIPPTVQSIGYMAFQGCLSLTNVTMMGGLISIGPDAFAGTSLTTVTIPDSVTSIGEYAFSDCTKLASVTIGNHVTSIGAGAFALCSLVSVIIPASVTSIGEVPFVYCHSLTGITVEANNLTYSGVAGVLFNKTGPTLVQYPAGRPSGGYIIPEGVTSIANWAFYGCDNLTLVTVPSSVTSIGDHAFYYCAPLPAVYFEGNAPTSVGTDVFQGAASSLTVYYNARTTGWNATFAGRPTALASPCIVTQPASQMYHSGMNVTLTVAATGMPSLSYQWRKNGTSLAGAAQSSYSITNAQAAAAGTYSVAITNAYGRVISSNATLVMDNSRPSLAITSPTPNQLWSTAVFRVKGTARDNVEVGAVWCLTNGVWGQAETTNRWTNWWLDVALVPGTNVVRACAVDAAWNWSLTQSVSFFYVVTNRLVVEATGTCTMSPNYSNAWLELGRSYTTTATPKAGYLFSNWVVYQWGDIVFVGNTPTLTFTMQPGLSLQANIVPNPFPEAAGTYKGLFGDTDGDPQSQGFLTVTVTTGGAYSGSLKHGTNSYSISGHFDLSGLASQRTSAWLLLMQLPLGEGTNSFPLSGTVSNEVNGGWVAYLWACRTTTAGKLAGQYTLDLQPPSSAPLGDGCAAMTMAAGGQATLTGWLPDGTPLSLAVPLVHFDQRFIPLARSSGSDPTLLPIYVLLYGGQGSLWGWLSFVSELDAAAGLQGSLSWFRPGIFDQLTCDGSRYTPPTTGRVIAMTNGIISFSEGRETPARVNRILLTAKNQVINQSSNKLTLSLTLANGLFSGSVQVPGTSSSLSFKGVLLQDQAAGFGYFLGTKQSGFVYLGAPQ